MAVTQEYTAEQYADAQAYFSQVENTLQKYVLGQEKAIHFLVSSYLLQGHILFEGNPGTAKTFLAKALSQLADLEMARIQGTPDLMPSDIVGGLVLNAKNEIELVEGPLLKGQIIFIDEINRMNPRTQSVTLQAMQEGMVNHITINKPLKTPNMFIATRNPIDQEGTYPLPEAQLDRFLVMIQMDAPNETTLMDILKTYPDKFATESILEKLMQEKEKFNRINFSGIKDMINAIGTGEVLKQVAWIVTNTTPLNSGEDSNKDTNEFRRQVYYGGSPRGAQALIQLAKANAFRKERLYVNKHDVHEVIVETMQHRIQLKEEYALEGNKQKVEFFDALKQKFMNTF